MFIGNFLDFCSPGCFFQMYVLASVSWSRLNVYRSKFPEFQLFVSALLFCAFLVGTTRSLSEKPILRPGAQVAYCCGRGRIDFLNGIRNICHDGGSCTIHSVGNLWLVSSVMGDITLSLVWSVFFLKIFVSSFLGLPFPFFFAFHRFPATTG